VDKNTDDFSTWEWIVVTLWQGSCYSN